MYSLEGVGMFGVVGGGALVRIELVLASPPVDGIEVMVVAEQTKAAGERHVLSHLGRLGYLKFQDLHCLIGVVCGHACWFKVALMKGCYDK